MLLTFSHPGRDKDCRSLFSRSNVSRLCRELRTCTIPKPGQSSSTTPQQTGNPYESLE